MKFLFKMVNSEDVEGSDLQAVETTNLTVVSILDYSCWQSYETVACIRSITLASLAALTAILCVVKLIRLHLARHPSPHQYVIFYAAGLECATGCVHWIFLNVTQLDFVLQYIKLLQVLIMCHYYITLAIRALRKENLSDRFMYPFLCAAVLYFTIITSVGIFNAESAHVECIAPYWLALSAAELVVVQLFAVSGFYITRRLNEISTLDSVRWAQKRDLWCVVVIFELSALGIFIYDLTLQIIGDRDAGCSAIFSYQQVIYSPLLICLMVVKLFLPIWIMLLVFQPHATPRDKGEALPAYSEDGTYGSVFSDDMTYRQLYQPVDSFNYSTPSGSPGASPAMYDAALPPYVYVNPAQVRSSLQTIAEENNEEKQEKQIPEVKICQPTLTGTDKTETKSTRAAGPLPRGRLLTRIIARSSKVIGDIL